MSHQRSADAESLVRQQLLELGSDEFLGQWFEYQGAVVHQMFECRDAVAPQQLRWFFFLLLRRFECQGAVVHLVLQTRGVVVRLV